MAGSSISIVMKLNDEISGKLKTIASTSRGCSKAMEEFQRCAKEAKGKLDALSKKYDSFNQKSAAAKTGAEKLKIEMSAMTKAAKASGQELDLVNYEKLRREYQRLSGAAAGAIAGVPGMIVGGVLGTASGMINGQTQIEQAQDEAFKEYYPTFTHIDVRKVKSRWNG